MEIEKRLDSIEERIVKNDEKIAQLDKSVAVYSAIFERNLSVQEKLSNSIDKLSEIIAGIRTTLIEMQNEIKSNSDAQEGNSNKINKLEEYTSDKIKQLEIKLHERFEKVDTEIDKVDEKGKFDFLVYVKNNIPSLIILVYIGYETFFKK